MKALRAHYEQALTFTPVRLMLALVMLAPMALPWAAAQAGQIADVAFFASVLAYLWLAYDRLIVRNIQKESPWRAFLGHVLIRIAVLSLFIIAFTLWLYRRDFVPNLLVFVIEAAFLALIVAVIVNAYKIVIENLDHRSTDEASWRRALPELLAGVHVTAALFVAAFVAVLVAGYVRVPFVAADLLTGFFGLLHELCYGMVLGAALEILLRGVLFRYFEKMIGTLGAILGLVGICAILHLVFWPDRDQFHSGYYSANFASVTIVALIMGAGLSLVFAFTRSLWPCIAAQAVWFAFERHPLTGERPTIFLVDVAGGNVPPVWTGFGLGVQGTIPFIVGGLLVLRWLAKRSKEKQLVGYEGVPAPQKG